MLKSFIRKPGLQSWLLLGLGLVCILVIESCVCCTGELNRRIGRDDLRSDAEKKTSIETKNLPAPSLQESPAKSQERPIYESDTHGTDNELGSKDSRCLM
jgi:hypothetical protein